jgi:phosphoglycolate phosphatase
MAMKKSNRYDTVIWDWNGTLLNDARTCCEIINVVLKRHGLRRLTPARYREIFDFPVRLYYERMGFDFTKLDFETVGAEFVVIYEQQRHRLRLQPGAREILQLLKARSVTQIVLSAYRHDTLVSLLEAKQLQDVFARIVGADDVYARGKKEQGRQLMTNLKLAPSTSLMVGDTLHDHEVATAMGIDCVLLDAGHQARHRLDTCGVPVFDDLAGLQAWLKGRIHVR